MTPEEARRRYRLVGSRASATSRVASDIGKLRMRKVAHRRFEMQRIERWRRIRALSEAGYSLEEAAEAPGIAPNSLRKCVSRSEHWIGWPLREREHV